MIDQTNAPGVGRDLGWLVRTSRMMKFFLWIVLVALGIATAVGLAMLAQFGAGKTEIAKLRAELHAVN